MSRGDVLPLVVLLLAEQEATRDGSVWCSGTTCQGGRHVTPAARPGTREAKPF